MVNVINAVKTAAGIWENVGSSLSVMRLLLPQRRALGHTRSHPASCAVLPLPAGAVSAVLLTLLAWTYLNDRFFIVRMQFQNAEPSLIRWFSSSAPWNKMEKSP